MGEAGFVESSHLRTSIPFALKQISKSVGYPFKTYCPDSDPEPSRIVANYFKQF